MSAWEHHSYTCEPGDKVVDILNRMGADGWEAWHVQYGQRGAMRILFKRVKG